MPCLKEYLKKMEHTTFTLANGMRVICRRSSSEVVYCGVAVAAGTRHERENESGIAHFTEHLSFKGTVRRSAKQIVNRMEKVGGDLNAYTGKEETVYYSAFLRPHLYRAISTLFDIVFNSTYPQREMDKEVEVVIDEIESYNDQPSELIYDEFEELLFGAHPLGRSILGKEEVLRGMKSADISSFVEREYLPSRMVLYVYGDVAADEVMKTAEKALKDCRQRPSFPCVSLPDERDTAGSVGHCAARTVRRDKGTHQSHVVMGTKSFGGMDPRHLHLYLLNNILGGPAFGSRLNLSLREKCGLVYTVESNSVCYTDTGVWSVYFGCDTKDVDRCLRLVRKELDRLTCAPLSQRALDAARRQLKGQIGISCDNGENVAMGMAKRFLHYHSTQSMSQLFGRLDDITPGQLHETACSVFAPSHLVTLIYEGTK